LSSEVTSLAYWRPPDDDFAVVVRLLVGPSDGEGEESAGLESYLARRVERCEGRTWEDVAEQLARLGYWEFEDYRE